MKIRALSVFEGVVYHCWPIDTDQPCRPTLEVEAVLRPGDADAEAGPLLLSVADYIVMAGGLEVARPCLRDMAASGRIVEHLGVQHIAFPTWTPVATDDTPIPDANPTDTGLRNDDPTSHGATSDDPTSTDPTSDDPTSDEPHQPDTSVRPTLRMVQPPPDDGTGQA
jgi:hypothetical protein